MKGWREAVENVDPIRNKCKGLSSEHWQAKEIRAKINKMKVSGRLNDKTPEGEINVTR